MTCLAITFLFGLLFGWFCKKPKNLSHRYDGDELRHINFK